jgi:hypothetical protein
MPASKFNKKVIYENKNLVNYEKKLNIIHFNDVYNIESNKTEPVGGASRFITALEDVINETPTIVLFSGDAISPSSSKFIFPLIFVRLIHDN